MRPECEMNNQQDSCAPRTSRIPARRPPSRPPSSHCPAERDDPAPSPGLERRSTSLSTIPTTAIQPRMAQLETLEAKMASIEVSLSNTPRRKKNGSVTGSVTSSVRSSSNKDVAAKELESLRNALRDKENVIQNLRGQLSGPKPSAQIGMTNGGGGAVRDGNDVAAAAKNGRGQDAPDDAADRRRLEERLNGLRNDTDKKRLTIKKLKMALERSDVTDNIDVRIRQAELEYQVGREELNLLTLLEEARALQICLEESNKRSSSAAEHTFYSCLAALDERKSATLRAIDLTYDPKMPNFGAGPKEKEGQGLWVDWTLADTGLRKGDRLIEANGKIVLTRCRDDLVRLLSADPDPAQIVVLRKGAPPGAAPKTDADATTTAAAKEIAALRSELEVVRERAEEAQRAKDGLRSDNIRLTHRISYLEEQVSEMLNKRSGAESDIRIITGNPVIASTVKSHHNITNINITSQSSSAAKGSDLQVFQKGPQVTALIQNVHEDRQSSIQFPIRSKSSLSNASNEQPVSVQNVNRQRHKYRNSNNINARRNGHNDNDVASSASGNTLMEQSYKKATKIVQDLTKGAGGDYDKHQPTCFESPHNTDILKHYNARKSTSVLDFRSEVRISPKFDSRSIETLENITVNAFSKRLYKKHDVRSVKSLDFDSDCNGAQKNGGDYQYQHVYDKPRPMPPKKPIRLSLHRAQSAQSVENPAGGGGGGQEIISARKPTKRNYKSEILAASGKETTWNANKFALHKGGAGGVRISAENASWC